MMGPLVPRDRVAGGDRTMETRLGSWWRDLQDSLWFTPALMTALYGALALALVEVDRVLGARPGTGAGWPLAGDADVARGTLFAIAGTMVSVIAVVFSMTMVALQIAVTQLTPRVLRTFTGDKGTQHVLGVFLGTFTYALLVLRAIRPGSEDEGVEPFVPAVSVTIAIGLALVGIGVMIYYIHHVARLIQVPITIGHVTHDTLELIDEGYPAGRDAPALAAGGAGPPGTPGGVVRAGGGGYLQAVDADVLLAVAEEHDLFVRMEPLVGEFVLPGAPLATVWPAGGLSSDRDGGSELTDAIRAAFVLGLDRTRQQDVEFGVRQLADIAVKALSPAINDPTTATHCIDRLGEVLVHLARRGAPEELALGRDGRVRLVLPAPSFERLADTAFAQIRHYGGGDAMVAAHLATTLGRVAALVPPDCRPPLAAQARMVLADARSHFTVPADLTRVERAATWAEVVDGDEAATAPVSMGTVDPGFQRDVASRRRPGS